MGELLALIAGVCFALGTMLTQRGMRRASASIGVMVSLLVNNLVFAMCLLVIFYQRGLPLVNWQGILFAAGGGLVGNLFGRTANFQAVRRIGSAQTIMLSLSQILFTLLWGILLLGEMLTVLSFSGICLVLIGIYWLAREHVHRQEDVAASEVMGGTAAASDNVRGAVSGWVLAGIALALTSGFAYSIADLLRKISLMTLPSAVIASALGGIAALMAQSLVFTLQRGWQELRELDRFSWLNLVMAGVAGGWAILALNSALSYSPIVVVNALYNIRVWFAIAMGPILLGDAGKITGTLVGSAFFIVVGTLIIILG